MTINLADNTPRIEYSVAQGVVQTVFAVPFEFFDNGDLTVYVDGVQKYEGSDFSISGGDGSTGSITFNTAVPPEVQQVTGAVGGSTVVIVRDIAIERTTDFTSNAINRAALNTQLDTIIGMIADLDDKASRTLQISDYEVAPNISLPSIEDRAGRVIAFDGSGNVAAGPTSYNIDVVASNIAEILQADDNAAAAAASAAAALVSETNAFNSANAASASEIAAEVSETAALTSEVNAATSEENAALSEAAAAASETAAALSEAAAATSATNAATSETNAATSATNAATSETAAATSASNASDSETAAATSETNAATSATNAATSATDAATSAANAAASETAAATSATDAASSATAAASSATASASSATAAASSATAAATSESNAATSAAAASNSQIAAAASAAAAANVYDTFDDRYLGSKSADPTLDNDGNPLAVGSLYFNNVANEMRVYDGGNWVAASAAGGVSLLQYEFTATAGQTTFSGTDRNGNTLSYTQNNIIVFLNGVALDDGGDYTASNGTSIVLTTGATAGDLLYIIAFKPFTSADMVSASNGGIFYNDITIQGNLTITGTVDGVDISGLASVATSGDYNDLINTPAPFDPNTLAIVATTGSYTDLINIPANIVTDAAYVHTDNNYTTTEKNKLAGIEAGATADQTAAEILTAIKTVDGAGSGLDADTLDGNQASAFALASHTHDYVPERNRSDWNDGTVIGDVIGQMAWKNYGNNHTIFDASASTSPNGTAVNNTNSDVPWAGSYPTLMGWNGINTYGVRVDSARISDYVINAPAPSTAQVGSATAGLAANDVGTYGLMILTSFPSSQVFAGTTISGSNLRYANAGSGAAYYNAPYPSGTWRLHGYVNANGGSSAYSVFMRIS